MRIHRHLVLTLAVAVLTGCSAKAVPTGGQRVAIHVTENGFEPAVVNVKAGSPVTLLVTRLTDQTCATELVIKAENVHQSLPLNHQVAITFTPEHKGDVTYVCGMDMLKGTIRVE